MAMTEKIRILLIKRKMTVTDLAKLLDMSQSNLSNKLSRDNFSEKELEEIASALNVRYYGNFEIPETGETI